MASIITLSLNLEKLDKSKIEAGKNGGKYYPLAVRVVDNYKYGKNAFATTNYTPDEKSAGATEERLGNGRVVWTNGQIEVAVKEDEPQVAQAKSEPADDFPF